MDDEIPSGVRELLEEFGASCAIHGLSWEETEKLFCDMMDAVEAERDRGCTCPKRMLISVTDRAFRIDHYDGCELA